MTVPMKMLIVLLLTGAVCAEDGFDVSAAVQRGVQILVERQEGEGKNLWPYEGVYRERGKIPIGYEVGGTGIVCLALVETPGYGEDSERQQAVRRSLEFVLDALQQPLMDIGFNGGYDVRGWGHTYALLLLLRLQDLELVPGDLAEAAAARIPWLVKALEETAMPSGGWSYSRRAGFGSEKNQAAPFMTAPTLQALFHAQANGYPVDEGVVDRALGSLERARTAAGGLTYSTPAEAAGEQTEESLHFMNKLPGAIARMAATETTLLLAGRGSQERLRHAVESFFEHWENLEARRQQQGTHIPPYGVAPYYFMFGHTYVAQAIEMLEDQPARVDARQRLRAILARVQDAEGSWNDRVFPRSQSYGTAMALLALQAERLPPVPRWSRDENDDDFF